MGNLDEVLKYINKKYGEATIRPANEVPNLVRVPTNIFSIDAEIGGGIPKGRLIIFAGNESTGKTTVAKKAMVEFQKTCKYCINKLDDCSCGQATPHKAVFVDIEGAFDSSWFSALGGDLSQLLLLQPEFAEEAVDIVEALVRTGEVDIIVVDSIAMMSPLTEIDKSSEDLLVGTHARLINRMMRSIQSGFNSLGMTNQQKPAVILINQIRSKVGVMYGDTTTYPGGLGQRFASSITLKFTVRPSEILYKDAKKKDEPPIGVQVRFKVEKNKTFLPLRSGMFTLYVSNSPVADKGSFNNEEQIVDYGVRYGLIERSGAWLTPKVTVEGMEATQYQGKPAAIDALIHNPEFKDVLSAHILAQIIEEAAVTIRDEDDEGSL